MTEAKRQRIIVTGANGMMGSDVVPILEREFEVIPTDIPRTGCYRFRTGEEIH